MDIRIIKYEQYIKENPEKAYGFYCLGRLYFNLGKYNAAENYFKKALSLDEGYTRAIIALIELYVYKKKFIKAVFLFPNTDKILIKIIYLELNLFGVLVPSTVKMIF